MRIIGRQRIQEWCDHHAPTRQSLAAWLYEVEGAQWQTASEVLQQFPSARLLNERCILFSFCNQNYYLGAHLSYIAQAVLVKQLGAASLFDNGTFANEAKEGKNED